MAMHFTFRVFLALLVAVLPCRAREDVIDHTGKRYRVVVARPSAVRVLWKDETGGQLRTFTETRAYCSRNGIIPGMLMNGGIFEPGGIPSGLCIHDGKQWTALNAADGKGNFFLKPNGIFAIAAGKAMVLETSEFSARAPRASQAVQSGPMLVRNGAVHPEFRAESANLLHRNGVGIRADGMVVFAITDSRVKSRVNLHQFASFFLSLNCRDALFLDGDISQMWTAGMEEKPSNPFGTIVVVEGGD